MIKVGGGCLKGRRNMAQIVDLMASRGAGNIFVVSALHGITDTILASMESALSDESRIPQIIGHLKNRHRLAGRHLILGPEQQREFGRQLNRTLGDLERLYYGLNFTREITPRLEDIISSFGERFAAQLLACALDSRGVPAACHMPQDLGLITDGKYGDATVNLRRTVDNFTRRLVPALRDDAVAIVPGFYGISESGEITTFGRGGSDYSAAVVASAAGAEVLEIWKDVDGYLSADPRFVDEVRLIPRLSYDEAAELSYFGAKILHPRTVEPLRKSRLNITIRNTLAPDRDGSVISARSPRSPQIIKSVAHDSDIGILKVHASGVGARLGILSIVARQMAENGINIRSVVTSQTCISLLLRRGDLEPGYRALQAIRPRPYRRLQCVEDAALISIVGQGIAKRQGVAARCFTAVAQCAINVEMISFGPSPVAMYFIVQQSDLERAVRAIHSNFFGDPVCF